MTYYAEPNYIQFDECFDNNIDPCELEYEKNKSLVILLTRSFINFQNIIYLSVDRRLLQVQINLIDVQVGFAH